MMASRDDVRRTALVPRTGNLDLSTVDGERRRRKRRESVSEENSSHLGSGSVLYALPSQNPVMDQ